MPLYILCACEESQRVCAAFRNHGHEAYSCDILDQTGGLPQWHIKADVLPLLSGTARFFTCDGQYHVINKWDMIIAFPPCTHLCVSGNRWFTEGRKPYSLRLEAVAFFYKFVMADCDKIAIENPIGVMSTAYRKPDQIIHPYMFGDPVQKATCLWLKGLPKLIETNNVKDQVKFHTLPDGRRMCEFYVTTWRDPKHRVEIRSKTFPGIAEAMANQWSI